jgi:hypothetical protein
LSPLVNLGEGRTTEREARFIAEDGDRPGVALLAQRGRRVARGHAAAYDHDAHDSYLTTVRRSRHAS